MSTRDITRQILPKHQKTFNARVVPFHDLVLEWERYIRYVIFFFFCSHLREQIDGYVVALFVLLRNFSRDCFLQKYV